MKNSCEKAFIEMVKNYCYAASLMFKFYPIKFCCQMFFLISTNLTTFFTNTYMLRYVVNSMQEGKAVGEILSFVLILTALRLLISCLRALYETALSPIIDKRSQSRLEKLVLKRSLEIDLANYEDPVAFEMYNRAISNGAGAIGAVVNSIGTIVSVLLGLSLDFGLIIDIDPMFLVFVVVPFILLPLKTKIKRERYTYRMNEQEINRKKDYTRRTFFQYEFAKDIRLTDIHNVMQRRFSESIAEKINLIKTRGKRISGLDFLCGICQEIFSVRIPQIYSIYLALVSRTILYGDCLVILNTVELLANSISVFVNISTDVYDIALNINDYRTFMEKKPSVSPNHNGLFPVKGDIRLDNVTFRYNGSETDSLKNINLNIRQGEHLAIVGYNGAGKTTLVKLLMRLYDPTCGTISLAGRDVRDYILKEYRLTYGVVFQDYKVLSVTVAENVLGRAYLESDEQNVIESLKKAGLWNVIEKQPQGIHTVLTKEFDGEGLILSGGQLQKLAIASVYARNVDTVILDEPSSALDPLAERELYDNMLSASRGKTVIYISHRLSSAVDADRIVFMENGEIVELGSHDELMNLDGKYAQMFRMQSQNYTH